MLLCRTRRPPTLRYLSFTPDVKGRNHVLAEVALTGSVNARRIFLRQRNAGMRDTNAGMIKKHPDIVPGNRITLPLYAG